ncbi:tyrosine-type recombinase/integrase [Desulfovibrio sulfodismutans]|uniref:Tyrosine-type recombinase/integrase n=1 Tax=Desulfolutivibrio sulfodismutans TaxID=63561 RepID=A0A7K3NK58_9BACT|nr:tyrosine-type recombinase/integrase [Desulfolutivibrio sulfodismutans]NDY55609.1 tyrosine-type recombinase/integrase [Desulfolutivibrio sulfodismutans]QLA11689.1 tyrosine-type recombinase/integrase [Desulfolutivibrio sulfodismutans DSM 3696]
MRVEPITNPKHIKAIKKLLNDKPRDRLLFIMGTNSGLRAQDILSLKVSDVKGLNVGDRITIKEKKTKKYNVIIINEEVSEALSYFFETINPKDSDYLFKSRKGANYPLTTFRVTRLVQSWVDEINLNINAGAHTLRKTFCYIQRTQFGVPWEVISKRCNHSSPSITRRYLGVKEEEVEQILLNNI